MTEKITAFELRKHCRKHGEISDNCKKCKYNCYDAVTFLFPTDNEQPCFWSNSKIAHVTEMIEVDTK